MGREGGPSDRLGTNRRGGLPWSEPPATQPARCLGIGPRVRGFGRRTPIDPTGRPYGLAADRGRRRGATRLSRSVLHRPLAVPDQHLVLSLEHVLIRPTYVLPERGPPGPLMSSYRQ